MWVIILFNKFVSIIFSLFIITIPINAYGVNENRISAECAVVLDAATGIVHFDKNAYLKHSMASTTKIMTCLLACESGKLNDAITVSEKAIRNSEGTSLYLKAGDKITLLDLVKGAMLESGNDAANAIACYLAGDISKFADIMNVKAKEIGMNNTNFVTPSGLDAKLHYSSAYDMAILAAYVCKNSELLNIASQVTDSITVNGVTREIHNHNKLLSVSKCFKGLKTGFTKKSGRCLVSVYDYGGSKIVCVTLNAPDDWNDHIRLINSAKEKYKTYKSDEKIVLNTVSELNKSVNCNYSYSIKSCSDINIKLYYYPIIYTPVKKNDVLGRAEIFSGNTKVEAVNITADEDI